MSRFALAAGLILLAGLTGCVTPEQHRQVLSENRALQEQIAGLKQHNMQYQDEHGRLVSEIKRMSPLVLDAAALARQKKEVEAILRGLKTSTGGAKLPAGVSTHQTSDGLVVRVEGSVLFSSGSATLSKAGQSTLRSLSGAIGEHRGGIRVAGHTDTDKIRRSSWKTNMRLSVARGLAVLEFLTLSGVSEGQMSVAGYGPYSPIDEADKAKNRRVEIVLLKPK